MTQCGRNVVTRVPAVSSERFAYDSRSRKASGKAGKEYIKESDIRSCKKMRSASHTKGASEAEHIVYLGNETNRIKVTA